MQGSKVIAMPRQYKCMLMYMLEQVYMYIIMTRIMH